MQSTLSYRHRVITEDDLVLIRELIAAHPGSSRRELSKRLCQAWNWVQANGALRDMVCRGLMLMLHRRGLIELPPVRRVLRNPMVDRSLPPLVSVDDAPLQMALGELGPGAAPSAAHVRGGPVQQLAQAPPLPGLHAADGRASEVPRVRQGPTDRLPGVVLGAASPGEPRPVHRLGQAGPSPTGGKDDLAHKANRSIKQVLGYPLVKDFRQRLSQLAA